jgi:hypothetical protein
VLAGLRHHALIGGHHEEHELHADGAGDHGVDQPAVAGHIDEAHLHAAAEVPRGKAELDGDTAPGRRSVSTPVSALTSVVLP